MKVSIPADTLKSTIAYRCSSCFSSNTYDLQIQEYRLKAKPVDKGNQIFSSKILCSTCENIIEFEITFSGSQFFLNIYDVLEEEVEIQSTLDPYSELFDNQFDTIDPDDDFYLKFISEINNLRRLNAVETLNVDLNLILKKQIFIATITAMESYLSDKFITLVLDDQHLVRKFVETHPDFRSRKFDLKELFEQYDKIKDTCKAILFDTIYHNLPKVKEMYVNVLDIEFPGLKDVIPYVNARHDLVHRNGKTKDGKVVFLNTYEISKVIDAIESFIGFIENEITKKFPMRKVSPWDHELPF